MIGFHQLTIPIFRDAAVPLANRKFPLTSAAQARSLAGLMCRRSHWEGIFRTKVDPEMTSANPRPAAASAGCEIANVMKSLVGQEPTFDDQIISFGWQGDNP